MNKNYIILSIYMAIMGLGLFISKNIFKTPYNSPDFSEKFLMFMAILALLVLYHWIKNKKGLVLSTSNKPSYFISSILFVPVTLFGIYSVFSNFSLNISFFVLIVDTILIGIAEEIMYRGILIGDMTKRFHPMIAIILSSILFCALHILNIIGGLSTSEVINQMVSTFVMGVFLGAMYIDTKNIVLPIIFHSFWDYILLSGIMEKVDFMPILLIGVYVAEIVISLVIFIKIIKCNKTYFVKNKKIL